MFPIVNAAGKIVGFGGRVMDQGMPKYLNSSETPLFHKGSTLYGLYQAKEGIRQADRVVVVEGYLDVIALAQRGIGYAVATLGTALSVEHVRALSRYTKNIIALFDGDDAGLNAAARSFEIFVEAGLLGRAAFLPKDEDPDTFVRQPRQGRAWRSCSRSSGASGRFLFFLAASGATAEPSKVRAKPPVRLAGCWLR